MLESGNMALSPTVLFDEVTSPSGEMTPSVHTVAERANVQLAQLSRLSMQIPEEVLVNLRTKQLTTLTTTSSH